MCSKQCPYLASWARVINLRCTEEVGGGDLNGDAHTNLRNSAGTDSNRQWWSSSSRRRRSLLWTEPRRRPGGSHRARLVQ